MWVQPTFTTSFHLMRLASVLGSVLRVEGSLFKISCWLSVAKWHNLFKRQAPSHLKSIESLSLYPWNLHSGISSKHVLGWWMQFYFYPDLCVLLIASALLCSCPIDGWTWNLLWREMQCLIKARNHASIHLHWMKYQFHLATLWNASFICMGDQPYKA